MHPVQRVVALFLTLLAAGSRADEAAIMAPITLVETVPTVCEVRMAAAPIGAVSVFVDIPAPGDARGLGPLLVPPDGQALNIAQQILFPSLLAGVKARTVVLRSSFNDNAVYQQRTLLPSVIGGNCRNDRIGVACAGLEHAEVKVTDSRLMLTGNRSSLLTESADRVSALCAFRRIECWMLASNHCDQPTHTSPISDIHATSHA